MVQLTDHTEDLAYLPDADDRCINVGKVNSLTFIMLLLHAIRYFIPLQLSFYKM